MELSPPYPLPKNDILPATLTIKTPQLYTVDPLFTISMFFQNLRGDDVYAKLREHPYDSFH